jgi:hypothetical protein
MIKGFGQVGLLIVAAVITCAAGIHQGQLTNRWGLPQGVEGAAKLMSAMPVDIGSWHLAEPETLPAESQKILQCSSYVGGRYTHRETGEAVLVTTLLGPPGPMSVHRPEICFSAIDFPVETERRRVVVSSDGVEHSAWMVQFRDVRDPKGGLIRVYYTWSNGEVWTAADEPRISFGSEPFLFKAQIVVQLPEANAPQTSDPGQAFLSDFIPVFKKLTAQHLQSGSKEL